MICFIRGKKKGSRPILEANLCQANTIFNKTAQKHNKLIKGSDIYRIACSLHAEKIIWQLSLIITSIKKYHWISLVWVGNPPWTTKYNMKNLEKLVDCSFGEWVQCFYDSLAALKRPPSKASLDVLIRRKVQKEIGLEPF